MSSLPPLARWRLVLGEPRLGSAASPSGDAQAMDAALEWLYGRDPDAAERDVRGGGGGERSADLSPSALSVPEWISEIQRLFPKETIERLERDAVERYRIDEVVTSPEVLARVEPSPALLEAVLRTCLLYTSPSPRDGLLSRMPSSA